ncbi:MAG: DUF3880 domain-containing protein [Lachnospiraceae bacterium]|nr:DUF3880 domain-containing protein [Lachnospiraceae bacterium]
MKIIYMDWQCYAGEDMVAALGRLKDGDGNPAKVVRYPFQNTEKRTDAAFEEQFGEVLKKERPDFVLSFNYYPLISLVCNRQEVPYIAYVYDSPHISLYSYTVIQPCNHIYVFDSAVAQSFQRQGIRTVHYLPLAANAERLSAGKPDEAARKRFSADVAFVGGMYSEGHNFYERMEPGLDDYTRGYLEAVIASQLAVDGVNFVEQCLREDIVQRMLKAYPMEPNSDGAEASAWIYANYMLDRRITQLERAKLLTMIGEQCGLNGRTVALYTRDPGFRKPGIENRGRIDYYDEMPAAFRCAKINLNITLRSITSGIPLRVFDILGAGGFLLTNYQPDLADCFESGRDFVYYESDADLIDKIEYYLSHEDERQEIAANGLERVRTMHSWDARLQAIVGDVFSDNE